MLAASIQSARCARAVPAVMAAAKLDELTVYELKAVCRAKGLKVSGRKAELIARVAAAPPGVLPDLDKGGGSRGGKAKGVRGRKARKATTADAEVLEVVTAPPSVAGQTAVATPVGVVGGPTKPMPRSNVDAGVVGDAATEADVLTQREAEEAEDNEWRLQRRAQRRAKLSQYFNEEFTAVVGALEMRAGAQYALAVGAAPPAAAETSEPAAASRYIDTMIDTTRGTGRRLAWCREYDATRGQGTLVDLEQRTEWIVNAHALKMQAAMPLAQRVLHAGEFVEYEPDAARALAEGGDATDGWVCGILGWPLMCEAAHEVGAES